MSPFALAATPLVLGSGSPRRREILERLGFTFEVLTPSVDETPIAREPPAAYLMRVVRAKLAGVHDALQGRRTAHALLVADTSVIVDEAILGKPTGPDDARAMVLRLAGRTHEVHTRFAIGAFDPVELAAHRDQPRHEETVVTKVTFRSFAPGEAEAYATTGEGADKAGGYAVQGLGAGFVARIEGSYTGVVGLPACEVVTALRRLGFLA